MCICDWDYRIRVSKFSLRVRRCRLCDTTQSIRFSGADTEIMYDIGLHHVVFSLKEKLGVK